MKDIKQQFKQNIFSIHTQEALTIADNDVFKVVSNQPGESLVKINEGYKSNDVLQYLISKNIDIKGYNEQLPSLNDIFIQLVQDTHATARAFQNN